MSFIKRCLLLLCLSTAGVLSSSVSNAFENAKICGDTNIKAPQQLLQVTYGDNDDVDLGNKLTTAQVAQEPTEITFDGEPDSYYTLVMIDPDAPAPGQFLHWLKRNIKGSSGSEEYTSAPYVSPSAPPGMPHRYTFLVYKQEQKLDDDSINDLTYSTAGRMNFHIDEFAEKNQLGDPKFGNFFNGELAKILGI